MNLIPYKPYFSYMLYSALLDEGLKVEDMAFTKHKTVIVENEHGYLGFITFRKEQGIPCLVHFYIFKKQRSFVNTIKLFKVFTNIALLLGSGAVLCSVPTDKQYFRSFIKWWARKDEPYAIGDDGSRQYLLPAVWRGGATI